MRCQPTIIERLNVQHPGLESDVCDWMKAYITGAEISKRLLAKYKETVCVRTVNTYRKIRWQREQDCTQERKRHYTAIMEVVGEKGLDAGAAANLWEALQRMTPRELIALRRVQLDREQMKVLNKRAENQLLRLKAKLHSKDNREGGEKKPPDPLEIRRRIREIYGLHDDSAQFLNKGQTPGPALANSEDAAHGTNP